MGSIMLRKASESDRLELGKIYCSSWKEAYRNILPEAFLNSLTPECCAPKSVKSINNFILEENGTAAGLVNFGAPRETDTENRTLGELRLLYVLPEFWDKGIGRKLFGAAEEELRSVGYAGFYLWVLSGNIKARSFYEKMGMLDTGTEKSILLAGKKLAEVKYTLTFV